MQSQEMWDSITGRLEAQHSSHGTRKGRLSIRNSEASDREEGHWKRESLKMSSLLSYTQIEMTWSYIVKTLKTWTVAFIVFHTRRFWEKCYSCIQINYSGLWLCSKPVSEPWSQLTGKHSHLIATDHTMAQISIKGNWKLGNEHSFLYTLLFSLL